jgi:hypothetical protein
LLACCAGDAATRVFLNFTDTGAEDDRRSVGRHRRLGAGFFRRRRPLRLCWAAAEHLVRTEEIYTVTAALREHRRLTQA